jgi:hypothetical protein
MRLSAYVRFVRAWSLLVDAAATTPTQGETDKTIVEGRSTTVIPQGNCGCPCLQHSFTTMFSVLSRSTVSRLVLAKTLSAVRPTVFRAFTTTPRSRNTPDANVDDDNLLPVSTLVVFRGCWLLVVSQTSIFLISFLFWVSRRHGPQFLIEPPTSFS